MNIVHLIDSFSYCDGCGRHVYILARGQARDGHAVRVLYGGGDAGDLLAQAGLESSEVPLLGHRRRSGIRFVRGVLRLRRLFKALRPDIVHVHHYYAGNMARLAMRGIGALVQTVHSNIPAGGKLSHYPGRRIIAVSESTRRLIEERDPQAGRGTVVVYSTAEFPGFADELRAGPCYATLAASKPGRFIVGYVGRLEEVKGVRVLIESVAMLAADIPVTLAVAGSVDEDDDVLRDARDRGIDVVSFGTVRDVMPVLELVDVLVLPSYLEGFPLVILEAGLMGVATVASRIAGIPEVIEDGVTGLLVMPGDAPGLADGLRRLHADPDLRSRLGDALRETVTARFNSSRMFESIARVYQTALAERG